VVKHPVMSKVTELLHG
jgi:hypothetical protein